MIQKRSKISLKEKLEVISFFKVFGSQWSKISKMMGKFTENEIKNFVNATVRRNIRRFNKNKRIDQQIKGKHLSLLNIPELQGILLADKTQNQSWFDCILLSEEILALTKIENSDTYRVKELESFALFENNSEVSSLPAFCEYETLLPCEDLFS